MSKMALIVLIFFVIGAMSNADSQPPKPLPTPGFVVQPQNYPSTSQTNSPDKTTSLLQAPVTQTTYEKRSETAYFFSDASSPIEIDKWTYPESDDGYPVNNPVSVYVDIKSKSMHPVSKIQIIEETDPAFVINNTYGYCKIDPIKECFNEVVINTTSGQRIIGKIYKNRLRINITKLEPKEWIRYNYTILPRREGIYYIDTLVRIGSNTSIYKDLFLPLKVKIEPNSNDFNVIPRPDRYQAFKGENITITYAIQYLGNNPNRCKFGVMLDSSRNDFECIKNISEELVFNSSSKIQSYAPTIRFSQIGNQPLPGIIVSDMNYASNSIFIPLAGSLNIDTYYLRYKILIDYLIQFISILVSILIGIYGFQKKLEKSFEDLKTTIKSSHNIKKDHNKTISEKQIQTRRKQ